MGPPPRYLVTRKLVNHYFKKYLPTQPVGGLEEETLIDCWKKYGIDNPLCKEIEIKYYQEERQRTQYRGKIQAMHIKESVMKAITFPHYPERLKGRTREIRYNRQWGILDGLKH